MKVLLMKDVYKLGKAGEVKRVADGFGRNYLLPHGLAVLATEGALKQAHRIREEADSRRDMLNKEMSGVAESIAGTRIAFPARASETGKLYGSITTQIIAEELSKQIGIEISRRQIDGQPLRTLGEHTVAVRLTVDLVPEFTVVVYREGETPPQLQEEMEAETEVTEEAQEEKAEPEELAGEGELEAETDVVTEAETEVETETETEAESEVETE
jgi:large subunit ribosomal protein L9